MSGDSRDVWGDGGVDREEDVFQDLPAVLIEGMFGEVSRIGESLLRSFQEIQEKRERFRRDLEEGGFVGNESSLGVCPPPTTCAVDGSYVVDRLLAVDLTAAAAVAVEGLTPPSERRYWESPHHRLVMAVESHRADTATVLRAVMLGEEVDLASGAPHELVFLDGSLTLPIIYFNQAFGRVSDLRDLRCSQVFLQRCCRYLESYVTVLRAERSDRQFAGLPKYTTRREIERKMGWSSAYDDRSTFTFVLRAGEFTLPQPLEVSGSAWHLGVDRLPSNVRKEVGDLAREVIEHIQGVYVFYYRPYDWLPAFRVEVPRPVAENRYRLLTVIQGIRHQCVTGAMLEPYPVYLADRMVKAFARSIPAVRQAIVQEMAERYGGNLGEIFLALHGYRSESGGGEI